MSNKITNKPQSVNPDWEELVKLLPENWEEEAKKNQAVKRRFKKFSSLKTMLRVFLIHIANGLSLRETSARAKLANIADVSSVGIHKSIKKSQKWLKKLCDTLAEEIGLYPINKTKGKRFRAVDGTYVSEQGSSRSDWLVHYSMDLATLSCDYFDIAQSKGKGNGESLTRFPINKGDCILADRGFCSRKEIVYVHKNEGDILVRFQQKVPLKHINGEKFNILSHVETIKEVGDMKEWPVTISYEGKEVKGRICAFKKSKQATELCLKKQREKSKNPKKISPEAKKLAEYVIIFTTLTASEWSTKEIIDVYRVRWQIELSFKRLKSLLKLGHLPKYNPDSCKAWFYGKLLVAMLVEKSLRLAHFFSPCGY